MRFPYEEEGQTLRAEHGIAFGTPVACFLANVFLTPVDRHLDALPGLRYFRYADDLLMLSSDRDTIDTAIVCFQDASYKLKLGSKATPEENHLLSPIGLSTTNLLAA